jgi:sarcosine oxidase/L-pipecolate oxidase
MTETYDVVVVGGGPVGLATAYESAKAGKKVLLLEQYNLFNQSGSSGDLVRMFRTMYTGLHFFLLLICKNER